MAPTLKMILLSTAMALSLGATESPASQPELPPAPKEQEDVAKDQKDSVSPAEAERREQFLGWDWGVGVGMGFGDGDRIDGATLDSNRVVRVSEDVSDSPRLVFELHYFFSGLGSRCAFWNPKSSTYEDNCGSDSKTRMRGYGQHFGHGPFVSVNFGANDSAGGLSSFGLGYMVGFRYPNKQHSFNIGLGYAWDRGVEVLGDGIRENQVLPEGQDLLVKKETQGALLLIFSTKF
jgi:hypothetical protein